MIFGGFSKHEEPPREKKGAEKRELRLCHLEAWLCTDFLVQRVRQVRNRNPMEFIALVYPLRAKLPEWHPFPLPPLSHLSSSLLCKPNCQHLFRWTDLWWQLGKFALLGKWWIKPQSPGTEERLLPLIFMPPNGEQKRGVGRETPVALGWLSLVPYPSIGNCVSLYFVTLFRTFKGSCR